MENECKLSLSTETISPLKDQSLNSFSHDLTGHLGIVNLRKETIIHETRIENTIQDLCEITLTNKRLRKRPPTNTTSGAPKKLKTPAII